MRVHGDPPLAGLIAERANRKAWLLRNAFRFTVTA